MTASSDLAAVDLAAWFAAPVEIAIPSDVFVRPNPPVRRGRKTRDIDLALANVEPGLPAFGNALDKYTLERAIGIGGFAVVYRARHQILDTVFALKLLRPSVLRKRPELAHSLGDEARLAARIHHPNVVRVVDVTIGPEFSYVVMEHIEGLDLGAMLAHKGQLPPRMVLKIVSHVAAALRAGLTENLVHRDIKPSNILLTRQGVTKLVDFGLARSQSRIGDSAVVGTIGYMSPEHVEQPQAVDHRSDIFSLGITAYRAMTGVLPSRVLATAAQTVAALRSHAITPPHRLNHRVTPEASELVMWMLRLDPAQRPQDHATVIQAARAAAERDRRDR